MMVCKSGRPPYDLVSILIVFALSCVGLVFIFSTTHVAVAPYSIFLKKQLFGVVAGCLLAFVASRFNCYTIMRAGYHGFFVIALLLIYTLFKGTSGMGAQRWIDLVFFRLQPSELTKFFLPACIAYYLHMTEKRSWSTLIDFAFPLVAVGITFLLILKQPDLGTALIMAISGLIVCWLGGLLNKYFVYAGFVALVSAPLVWCYFLKPYQKKRIMVFLGHKSSEVDSYQIEQATIAIGSGGFLGKGLLQGTQNRLQFLPEGRTDFIFAVLCEEWGFFGALSVLTFYAILFIRLLILVNKRTCFVLRLFGTGLIVPLALSMMINIGMVLGLLPIVGQPLPFMSYGLCHLIVSYLSFGVLLSIVRYSHDDWGHKGRSESKGSVGGGVHSVQER
jgi:rod shape determining protein RodA